MNKKDIKISVIMSEYNTELKLLENSIESILNQTYKNFEFIIIDDCGKNDVKKIVKKYNDKRIIVHKNKENRGLVYSLNKAIELSTGEYLARMDTDDWSYPDRLEKQVNFIKNNPQYSVVGGKAEMFDGNQVFGTTKFSGNIDRKMMLQGSPLIHPTVIMKREDVINAGGYPNFKRCEDYALWIEMFSNGNSFYVLDDFLIKYHLSEDDYLKRNLKTREGFFKLLKKQYKKLKPSRFMIIKIHLKTFLAGILPNKIMYNYHKAKFKN